MKPVEHPEKIAMRALRRAALTLRLFQQGDRMQRIFFTSRM